MIDPDDDVVTPDELDHADEMAAQDAHYAAGYRHGYIVADNGGEAEEWPDCPHPVDHMGTVFAHPTGQARRVCTACWRDFGPLTPAERSAAVAQYPTIAEPSNPSDAAISGRLLVDHLDANAGAATPIEKDLIALIKHLDYQTMLLRNRLETISRVEQQAHAHLATVVAQRDAAEADVLDLIGALHEEGGLDDLAVTMRRRLVARRSTSDPDFKRH